MTDFTERSGYRRNAKQLCKMVDFFTVKDRKDMAFGGDLDNPDWIALQHDLNQLKRPGADDRSVPSWQTCWKHFKQNSRTKCIKYFKTGEGKVPTKEEQKVYYAEKNYYKENGLEYFSVNDENVHLNQAQKRTQPWDPPTVLPKKFKRDTSENHTIKNLTKGNVSDSEQSDGDSQEFPKNDHSKLQKSKKPRVSVPPKRTPVSDESEEKAAGGRNNLKRMSKGTKKSFDLSYDLTDQSEDSDIESSVPPVQNMSKINKSAKLRGRFDNDGGDEGKECEWEALKLAKKNVFTNVTTARNMSAPPSKNAAHSSVNERVDAYIELSDDNESQKSFDYKRTKSKSKDKQWPCDVDKYAKENSRRSNNNSYGFEKFGRSSSGFNRYDEREEDELMYDESAKWNSNDCYNYAGPAKKIVPSINEHAGSDPNRFWQAKRIKSSTVAGANSHQKYGFEDEYLHKLPDSYLPHSEGKRDFHEARHTKLHAVSSSRDVHTIAQRAYGSKDYSYNNISSKGGRWAVPDALEYSPARQPPPAVMLVQGPYIPTCE